MLLQFNHSQTHNRHKNQLELQHEKKYGPVFWNGLKKQKQLINQKLHVRYRVMLLQTLKMEILNCMLILFAICLFNNLLFYNRKADNWPPRLIMQLMPKQLIGNIGGQFLKDSKTVVFHPNPCEALDALSKVMSSGFVSTNKLIKSKTSLIIIIF